MNNRVAIFLGLIFLTSQVSQAQKYEFSTSAEMKNKIIEGEPLEDGADRPLLNAVDRGLIDITLIELHKPGIVKRDGPAALNVAVRKGDQKITDMLLAAGVSPNIPASGWYPVGEAALKGDVRAICDMMDYGADVSNRNDKVGNVQMALSKMHIDTAVILMLSGYKMDKSESMQIDYLSRKQGLDGISNFIKGIHPDKQLAVKMCKSYG